MVVGVFTCLIAISPIAVADWLDVIAEDIRVVNVRTGEAGTTVTAFEGDTLQVFCTEWVGLSSGHDVWETKTVQRWENRVTIDGQAVAIFNPTIAPGTMIGHKDGSSGIGGLGSYMSQNGLTDIRNIYPPVSWIATGTGNHEASCILNQPKQISDHVATNNVVKALIVVAAAPQPVPSSPQQTPPAPPTIASMTEPATRPESSIPSARLESNRLASESRQPPVAGTSEFPSVRTSTGSTRTANTQPAAAPPNPCRMEVSYYVPQPPIVETSSPSLQAGDQVQIQCAFEKRTRQLEWHQCDDAAKNEMGSLKFSQESGSRYSGMMIIDDTKVGVATSPVNGSSFDNTATWLFSEAGSHTVTCQVDNGLHAADRDSPWYLTSEASLRVNGRGSDREYRRFEPGNARRVKTDGLRSGQNLVGPEAGFRIVEQRGSGRGNNDLINPALNPQPEVPSSRRAGGNDMVNPALNPQPEVPSSRQAGGNDMVNPALNPQPEVPSSRQAGGNDMVNPALNPQPEVPSSRRAGGNDMVNPALNPQPEVPSSRQAGGNDMVNPALNPQPEVPSSRQAGANDMVNPALNPQPEVPSSRQAGGNDMVNPALNPQPEVPSRRLGSDEVSASPAANPLPDPPSPNLENNALDNFTGAAGQDLDQAADAQTGFTRVGQSQGDVAQSSDMNDAGTANVAATLPVAQSPQRLARPAAPDTGRSIAVAMPWSGTVMNCVLTSGTGPKVGGISNYDFWAENTSSRVIERGQRISWRAYGTTGGSSPFSGSKKDWTTEGTHDLQAALPVGKSIRIGSASLPGRISRCDAMAQ